MSHQKQPVKKSIRVAVLKQMATLITNGFGLVAALAWNNAIQETVNTYIKPYLPQGSGLASLLIYAILVTVFAVACTINIAKLIDKIERHYPYVK